MSARPLRRAASSQPHFMFLLDDTATDAGTAPFSHAVQASHTVSRAEQLLRPAKRAEAQHIGTPMVIPPPTHQALEPIGNSIRACVLTIEGISGHAAVPFGRRDTCALAEQVTRPPSQEVGSVMEGMLLILEPHLHRGGRHETIVHEPHVHNVAILSTEVRVCVRAADPLEMACRRPRYCRPRRSAGVRPGPILGTDQAPRLVRADGRLNDGIRILQGACTT